MTVDDLEARVADWLAAFQNEGSPEPLTDLDDQTPAKKDLKNFNGKKGKGDNGKQHLMKEYQRVLDLMVEHYLESWRGEQDATEDTED